VGCLYILAGEEAQFSTERCALNLPWSRKNDSKHPRRRDRHEFSRGKSGTTAAWAVARGTVGIAAIQMPEVDGAMSTCSPCMATRALSGR
jgi:hypothetical protein